MAVVFRRAIEASDLAHDIGFSQFPKGACGDAALLLARFLRAHGVDQIEYVLGWSLEGREARRSHAWLEIGGLTVDITADQFSSRPAPPVLVTFDRKWHLYFVEQERHTAELDAYDPVTRTRLLDLYRRVLRNIPTELRGSPA